MNVMGSHLIVLNSSDVVKDLLERRSVVYEDRVCKPFGVQFTTSVLTGIHASLGMLWLANCTCYSTLLQPPYRQTSIYYFRMGGSWYFALLQSGNLWRAHRRLFNRFFNASAVNQFDDKVHKAVNGFLRRLSESPERFLSHVHLCVSPRSTLALSQAYHMPFAWEALPGLWVCRLHTG